MGMFCDVVAGEWGELGGVLGGDHALIMTNGCPDPSSLGGGARLELPDAWFHGKIHRASRSLQPNARSRLLGILGNSEHLS